VNELERVEAAALRDGVVLGGGRAELVGGAICVAQPRMPIMELNRALPVGETVDLDAIAAWYDGAHTISTAATSLRPELERRSYRPARTWMKFERDASAAPAAETDARVEATHDRALVESLFGDPTFAAMVGAPGWSYFVAWFDGEPGASGALYVDGATAWLGIGFTLDRFRRRGAQSALLSARIEAARSLGATRMTTETGELLPDTPASSYNNIRRAGFKEAYLRPNWSSPA
jgi:GNAT superfamily N-acetyltransferase